MEENGRQLQQGNGPRKLGFRAVVGGSKFSGLGKSSPRGFLHPQRSHLDINPRRELKGFVNEFRCIRTKRVAVWLMLIAVWTYIGLHVQSQWAHSDHHRREFISYKGEMGSAARINDSRKTADFTIAIVNASTSKEVVLTQGKDTSSIKSNASFSEEQKVLSEQNAPKKRGGRSKQRVKKRPVKPKGTVQQKQTGQLDDGLMSKRNTSHGMIVGPFGKIEDRILEWISIEKRGNCDRNGEFASIVSSHSFTLIFHELSLTGAPISMMELATEILNCGGSVSAVVLSRKGGLITELDRRGIKVLNDKARLSFIAAKKSDLIIAGSAVCSSWIEQYLVHNPAGSSQIIWWIMENRREYFDRSKSLLSRVNMIIFLTHLQLKQWRSWHSLFFKYSIT